MDQISSSKVLGLVPCQEARQLTFQKFFSPLYLVYIYLYFSEKNFYGHVQINIKNIMFEYLK
jgi:hypothetical protein